jgi:tryptophanyl-tRNA synthetase
MSPQSRVRVLTGITTSGTPHLGNYVGAIRPAIDASRAADVESFYFLADYHALIKVQEPARVQRSTLEIAAAWLACGLQPDKVWFYRQSDIPEIPELTWLLTCVAARACSIARMHTRRRSTAIASNNSTTMRHHRRPLHVSRADGRRHPAVQRAPRAGGPRPGAAHRDGARFRAALQPSVRRTFHVAGSGDRRTRGHLARPRRPQDEQELRQHHPAVRAARAVEEADLRDQDRFARAGRKKDTQDSALFQLYQAFASPGEVDAMRKAYADGIAWGDAKTMLFERIDAEVAPMRERYESLMANPAHIEALLRDGAQRLRARHATPLLTQLREAVGLRDLSQRADAAASATTAKRAAPTFKQYREADGRLPLQARRRRSRAAAERRLRVRARRGPAGRAAKQDAGATLRWMRTGEVRFGDGVLGRVPEGSVDDLRAALAAFAGGAEAADCGPSHLGRDLFGRWFAILAVLTGFPANAPVRA